ncbi:MAG: carboxypeptidase regulatory-like domain-containing protein [Terriglobales bacterium]
MAGSIFRPKRLNLFPVLAIVLLAAIASRAATGGRVSGAVKDASGAVIPEAAVSVTNLDTGVRERTATNGRGFYSLPELAVGRYEIAIKKAGFKLYQRTGISIDTNSAETVDVVLEVGETFDAVTVLDTAVHAETTDTQMGDVISSGKMSAVPLNGRSYTDLLALQPGVVPATSLTSNTQQDVGVSALSPSGGLNPGTISINGQREFSNAFTVNGSDSEEDVNSGTAIIPNLDSIAEFRILTSNFDAEYGGHSGGQINVVTKSGSNAFHGDGFEFVRNTSLDARNYFSPARGVFDQNQFGGTFGGPIRTNKTFFFADYQGTRLTQGMDTGQIPVPSLTERNGIFPNGDVIPQSAWSAPAKNLLQYIPLPNQPNGTFATSAYNETLRDDKGAYRLDHNSHWGSLSAYYFLDDYSLNNPYPVAQSGASVPGFNALYLGRAQLLSLGDTRMLGSTAVNEFHFTYMRDHNDLGKPAGGLGVSLASQGFVTGTGTAGIVPLNPRGEGVENIVFNAFSIGTNANELRQVNNTFQWTDNFSKVVGRHTLKFGLEFHYDQVNTDAIAQFNGNFLFTGSTTVSDFEDFLLGLPSQYNQSQLQPFYGRNRYWGLYAQDGWHVRSNLTLNYGLRWDRIEPWYEKNDGISTFEAGKQSVVFPTAPLGILFPTDPGVPRTLAPPGNRDFAPRGGLAYAPEAGENTLLGKILGGPGKTSLRAGFGMYYTAIEALTLGILAGNAPFGITYSSPAPPLFAEPFISASTGQFLGQPFPVPLVTQMATSSHPNANVNWPQYYEPVSGIPGYATTNRIPYVEEYLFSLERQLGANTVLSASYVGTQSHRLLVIQEANPGNPALCLSLSQSSEVAPGSPTCAPFGESNIFTTASGQTINGTRGPLGANFGSDTNQATVGKSNYNSLQLNLRHSSRRLELTAGYTYGKSLDESSNLGEEVNPINPALSYALSSFDVKHNFVVSYNYKIPIESLLHASKRCTEGWEISGIMHFSSGLPVTLVNYGDNSLLGAEPNGINNYGIDEPDYSGGPLHLNRNPRHGAYFNASQFSENTWGTPGTAKRRFFHGPGLDNYDMALLKNVRLTEAKSLQFRVEGFNVFNHAQFFGPQSVDGNIANLGTTFGQVVSANPPRLVQLGLKILF